MARVNGSVYEIRVSNFVQCAASRVFGPLAETVDDAIESARQLGMEFMDSAQLADGEKQARAYIAALQKRQASRTAQEPAPEVLR